MSAVPTVFSLPVSILSRITDCTIVAVSLSLCPDLMPVVDSSAFAFFSSRHTLWCVWVAYVHYKAHKAPMTGQRLFLLGVFFGQWPKAGPKALAVAVELARRPGQVRIM